MSTITPEELLRLWSLEKITLEMAMGYLLQNLRTMQKEIEMLKNYIHQKEALAKLEYQPPLYKKVKKDSL